MENLLITTFESIQKACHITTFKCLSAAGLVILNITFGPSNAVMFAGIMMLCMIDFVTAITREFRNKVPIESKKAIRTAIKIAIYGLLVSSGFITESIIGAHLFNVPIAGTVCAFIAVTELISILENVGRMGYVVPMKLLNMLQDYKENN